MNEECRFRWDLADEEAYMRGGGPCDRALTNPRTGAPVFTWYPCPKCGQTHWCLPSIEADGTSQGFKAAVDAAIDAAHACGIGVGNRNYAPHFR